MLLLLTGTVSLHAQNNTGVISLSPKDTLICPGQTITLHGRFSSDFGEITSDDVFSDNPSPIGFTFYYFGQPYTQCMISANNFITFDLSYAGQYSSWVYNAGNKANSQLGNSILFPFHDINMGLGQGTIRYQTFGMAPNRYFVVEFCKTPLFSCGTLVTDQLVLYEGSNLIEHHIGEKPVCTNWQQGTAIQGLIGNNGSTEIFVPGRGTINTPWTAYSDGRRFTPNGISTYTIDSIPYAPKVIIPNADSNDIVWYEEGNPLPIGTGASIQVTPTAAINYYIASITGQNGCLGTQTYTYFDTVWINYGTAYDTTQMEICAGTTYNWFGRDLFKAGNYDTLLNTTLGCDSFLRLQLKVNPLPDVVLKGATNVEICAGSSTQLALANPASGTTYQWYRDGAPLSGETGAQINVSTEGTYNVVATTNKGCMATSDVFRLKVNPNPEAVIEPLATDERICSYDTLELTAAAGANVSDYRWTPEKPFRIITGADGRKVKGVFIEAETDVVLTVFNQYGCYDSDSIKVLTKPCCEVFVPNAFSPNGDGVNDFFNPVLENGQILLAMQVFDRYGKLVYNNTNLKKGWNGQYENGTEASSDVYMYYVKYTCSDGKLYERKESVTLIR